jgi:uncharacterized protein (DUF1778 family)
VKPDKKCTISLRTTVEFREMLDRKAEQMRMSRSKVIIEMTKRGITGAR